MILGMAELPDLIELEPVDESEDEFENFEGDLKESIEQCEKKSVKRQYKCALCAATFTRKKNRNTHQLGHTAKNFDCELCHKKFQYPR